MNEARVTETILAERGLTHGNYLVNSRISQRLKRQLEAEPGWLNMADHEKEAIHMIFHKIARAVAGKSNFADHWDDIAGYARLVSKECQP